MRNLSCNWIRRNFFLVKYSLVWIKGGRKTSWTWPVEQLRTHFYQRTVISRGSSWGRYAHRGDCVAAPPQAEDRPQRCGSPLVGRLVLDHVREQPPQSMWDSQGHICPRRKGSVLCLFLNRISLWNLGASAKKELVSSCCQSSGELVPDFWELFRATNKATL